MVQIRLDRFPDVCRICLQDKASKEVANSDEKRAAPEMMLPIENTTLEYGGDQTLAELLNELANYRVGKHISRILPNAICATCFGILEFVVHYRRKLNLTLRFMEGFAELRTGNDQPLGQLFSACSEDLAQLLVETNVCDSQDEIRFEDFLEQFGTAREHIATAGPANIILRGVQFVVKPNEELREESLNQEYLNVEYVEDESEAIQGTKTVHANAEWPEFLQESDDEHENVIMSRPNTEVKVIRKFPKPKQKPGTHLCGFCQYKTTSKEMFQHHLESHEADANPWKCSYAKCSEVYVTKAELVQHKREVHSKYVCDICGLIVKHKYTLEIHLRRHVGASRFPCQYCSTSFITSNELKLHLSVVHVIAEDYECNECGLTFKNKKSLTLHQKTHSNERSFPCDECEMAFKTSAHLRRHQNTVHRAIKFSCPNCSVSYGRKDKLRMHMEKVHKIQTYFPCDICLKTFSNQRDLEEHKHHHRNPQNLECGVCLTAFLDAKDFAEHLCITYREDYVCCDRDFKYHLQYNRHMFLVHGMKTNVRVKPDSDQLLGAAMASRKPIERCGKCGQTFATRKQKKNHMALCMPVSSSSTSIMQQQPTIEFSDGITATEQDGLNMLSSISFQIIQQ
ncbi:oocyte zinc finger protein XlCOF7.1-like isoform X2 [Uranotaenia lowii]|uniref:oocyte zinc finger protein XlCOF7.1-like isoform X2 n=1 Tax=Uranotaenia lowii TaxID=190385 RepID=UPI002479E99A|nr:oocyte zinc finger protein XlCOF7.1-like isoform X2 [Uranotaenia lowii]